MALKIHGVVPSQPTRAVLFLCSYKKLEYQLVKQSPIDPAEKRAEFRNKVNPYGLVPCLEDTDYNPPFILPEAPAILQYLCSKYKFNDLYPTSNNDSSSLCRRSLIDSYLSWHHENTRMISKGYVMHLNRLNIPFEDQNQEVLKVNQERAKNALNVLENRFFNNNEFLVNNQLSIADFLCFEEVIQMSPEWTIFDMDLQNDFPNVYKFCQTMKQIDGYDSAHRTFEKYVPFAIKRHKEWQHFVQK